MICAASLHCKGCMKCKQILFSSVQRQDLRSLFYVLSEDKFITFLEIRVVRKVLGPNQRENNKQASPFTVGFVLCPPKLPTHSLINQC